VKGAANVDGTEFTLEDLDIYVYVGPGSDAIVDLSSATPGTYDYFCSIHTDTATGDGMSGQVS
jgi:plastocyanin